MEIINAKQRDIEPIQNVNTQDQDQEKNSQDKSNRSLKIVGITIAILLTIVTIFVSLYFAGIFQQNQCSGRNMDDNCNCKSGYYKSGKHCVGPFNEDIFTKEDIHISLKGQDENVAPKIAKRHLEQIYHYTVNSKENHQFYSNPSKIVDKTSSHEIRVVTEEVNNEKFRLIAYLGHSNYTDPEGDMQQIEGYPVQTITQSEQGVYQQEQEDFDIESQLTDWQKRESKEYNITYEEYFSSQTPMARVELNKQGKILNLEVPINIREKFEQILINFLEHYSPDLSKYHYQVHKYIDENGDEIEEIIESGDEEDIDDVTSKAQLLENEVILESAYKKTLLANGKEQTLNQKIAESKNSKAQNGQIENGKEELDVQYFHTKENEKLGIKQIDVKFKVDLQLQDFNLIKEEELVSIEEDFKLNHVVSVNKEEYEQRKQQKLDEESRQRNKGLDYNPVDQDQNDHENRRNLLEKPLFTEKEFLLFEQDFLGAPIITMNQFICKENEDKPRIFQCQLKNYWSISGWRQDVPSGEFEVDARTQSMSNIPSAVILEKEPLFSISTTVYNVYPTPIGIPLFVELDFQFKLDLKVFASIDRFGAINLTAAASYDLVLKAYGGVDLGLFRVFLFGQIELFQGVVYFNFKLQLVDLKEVHISFKVQVELYPIKITYGIFYQQRVPLFKFKCYDCLLFKCCLPYIVMDWGVEKSILSKEIEFLDQQSVTLFDFKIILFEDSRPYQVIGDESQIGYFSGINQLPENDDLCRQVEVQSAGFNDGNFAKISLDGQYQQLDDKNGFHIMVFDFISLQQKGYQNFDTHANSTHIDGMINFIKSLNNGDFVAISVKGQQTTTDELWNTLEEYLGLQKKFAWRDSFAAFSQIRRQKGIFDHFYENEGKQAKVNSRFCQYDSDWITVNTYQHQNQDWYGVYVNQQMVAGFIPIDQSIFVKVLDQYTLEEKDYQLTLYSQLSEADGIILTDLIDRIAYGDLVIYGILGNVPHFSNNNRFKNLFREQLGLQEFPVNNEKIVAIARKGMVQGSALMNFKYQNMGNNAIAGSVQMTQLDKQNVCKTFESYTKSTDYMKENSILIDGVQVNINDTQKVGITYWIYDRYDYSLKIKQHFSKDDLNSGSPNANDLLKQKAGNGDIVVITTQWVHGQQQSSYDQWGYKKYLGFLEYMQSQQVYSIIAQKEFNTPLVDKYQVQYDLYYQLEQYSQVSLNQNLGVKAKFCSITKPQNYFYITSKGTNGDMSFTISKDNVQIYSNTNKGVHIIVYDKDTYLLKTNQIFDLSIDTENRSIQLAYYVNQIPEGDLVAYGVTGYNQQLNEQTLQILESQLGFDRQQYPVQVNDTIVAWGRKGYSGGTATILRKENGKGIAQIKVSPDIEPVQQSNQCKNIKVVSAGFDSGDFIKLYEDGVLANVEQVNGVHVFVYDQYTLERKYSNQFAWDQGQLLASFVDNVIEGDYVFIGVKEDPYNQMLNGGSEAFKKLGIDHTFTYRESFAAIGQKGISKAVMDFYTKETKLSAEIKGNICSRNKIHFSVQSKGNWDGKEFDVLKDGVSQLPSNNSTNTTVQGFNIAVFDQDTKNLTSFETFQNNASNASLLVDFVQNITYGDLVAYGIDENAQDLLTNDVQTKLEKSIGFDSYNYKVKKGDSLSGWGRKGLKKGEGVILKKTGTEGGANILGSSLIESKEEEKVKCKNINIKSNGSINYLKFWSDGLLQTTYKDKHGIHFIVLDKYTLNKKNMTYFDTYTDSTQAEKMVEFIDNIEDGDVVLYGVHTDASQYMTTAGYNALKLVGMDKQLQLFDSLAGFGFKGQSHGVYEHNSQNCGIDLGKQYAQVNNLICGQKTYETLDFEHFTVISETFPDTDTVNESYFKVKNGNETIYEVKNQTGMVVVIIDQKTRQVKKSRVIDVTTKWWELTDLVSFVQNGDYVAYGSAKNINLTNYGDKEHLQNLIGYDFDKNPFKIDYGFAAFARKGYTKGQAVILDRDPIYGKAIVSASPRIPINIPVDQTFCKSIFIESYGLNDGDYSNIYVNGQVINKASDDSNSIFLVVFDQYTLEKKFQHVFQTGSYNLAYQNMAQRIDSIQDGDYVALTVRGDAQQYMNTEGFTALSTLGINIQFGRNDSFAAFTRKGSQQPAIIDTFQSGQGKKAIVQGSFCSDQDKDSKLYSINFDNSNSSQNYTLDIKYGDQSIKSYSSNIAQLIFVVIDQETNQVTQTQTYDNLHDLNQQYSAVTFLETLKKGDTVVYTMARDYSIMFGYELVNALEHLLGYVKETEVWANDSMIVMARVGMSRGLAEMHVRKSNKGPAIIFSSPNRNIPQFAQVCKNIQVSSSDLNHGNNLEFLIDNQSISLSSNTQGFHIAVINKFTLEVKYKQVFNPSNQTELQNLGTFIDGINTGDYVLLGVKEDGSGIDQPVYDKIKNLGIDTQIGYRETFAAIGRKGISKGIFDLTATNQNYKSIINSHICAQDSDYIHVESKGKQTNQTTNANFFRVDHNGQQIYNSDLRGIHFVVFDQDTLQVKSKKVFNPHDRVEDNQSMQEYIQMIPLGDIVAYGVSDDGSQNLSTESIKALEDYLGLKLLSNLYYNDSLAAIGRKGMNKGQALVNHKGSQQNSAKVFQSYNI